MPDQIRPDKHYNNIKRVMEKHVKRWGPMLGLDKWTIHVNWNWSNKKDISSGHIVGGETYTSWPYLHAHLDFYLPDLAAYDTMDLEEIVVHELVHVITAEGFQNDGACTPNQERVVTELARSFLRVDRSK